MTRFGWVDPGDTDPATRTRISGPRASVSGMITISDGAELADLIEINGPGKKYEIAVGDGCYLSSPPPLSGGDFYFTADGPGLAQVQVRGTAYNGFAGTASAFLEFENLEVVGGVRNMSITTVDSGRQCKPLGGGRSTNCLWRDMPNQAIGSGRHKFYVEDTGFLRPGQATYFNNFGSHRSAAAMKFANAGDIVLYNVICIDSGWAGFWFDWNTAGTLQAQYVTVLGGYGKAFHYEKSGGSFDVDHALIKGNNLSDQTTSGGCVVNGSRNFSFQHMYFDGNHDGSGDFRAVNVISDARPGGYEPEGTIAHCILNDDRIDGCSPTFPLVDCFDNAGSDTPTDDPPPDPPPDPGPPPEGEPGTPVVGGVWG